MNNIKSSCSTHTLCRAEKNEERRCGQRKFNETSLQKCLDSATFEDSNSINAIEIATLVGVEVACMDADIKHVPISNTFLGSLADLRNYCEARMKACGMRATVCLLETDESNIDTEFEKKD